MGNLFVLDTQTLNEADWQALKKIDKSDNLILMVSQSGMLPYQIIPHLFSLKKEPEVYPLMDLKPLPLSFFLGMQCATLSNGKCYVVSTRTDLNNLNDTEIEYGKISIKVSLFDTLEAALLDKKNDKSKKSKAETTTSLSLSSIENGVEESPIREEDDSVSDIRGSLALSDAFIGLLKRFSTADVSLVEYKEIIAECVLDSSEGVISAFKYMLKIKLGDDLGEKVYDLLGEHIEELKASL